MTTPSNFIKLSLIDLNQITHDEDAYEMYIDSLALIDDILCEFIPDGEGEHPRFGDVTIIERNLLTIHSKVSGYKNIKENAIDNLVVAKNLRNEVLNMQIIGERSSQLELTIKKFRDDLIDQYIIVVKHIE